ncbi:MAG: class I SAM-dependent methyltransferase [Thermoplasmata archaeon]
MYAVVVEKKNGEKIRKKLELAKKLDHARKIELVNGNLILPVTEYIKNTDLQIIEYEGTERSRVLSPFEKIKAKIDIPESLKVNLPNRWEQYGSVLILKYPRIIETFKNQVLPVYAEELNVKTILHEKGKIHDIIRVPDMDIIYGNDPETIHIENGIKYKFDTTKIMFSSGNVNERVRMSKINVESETIIDMFAGIGYFALPLAKYQKPEKIFACELNPIAFKYLKENIELNKIENIEPYLGDNRTFDRAKANRILMGYIDTEQFIPKALSLLYSGKGILHFHNTWTTEELKNKDETLKKYAKKYGFEYDLLYFSIIKSYAPHIWHIVADLKIL